MATIRMDVHPSIMLAFLKSTIQFVLQISFPALLKISLRRAIK
uniref:Uncharacterized protein n=1 Tax=Heterorhabditis bacteriophora TaxID=37862 RepID=A0A1I7XJK8_HETBA